MSQDNRAIVFCAQEGVPDNDEGYTFFTHEADVLMMAAASEVRLGQLTPAEARKLLEPYREVLSVIFTGDQQAAFAPHRMKWSNADYFPSAESVQECPHASQIFWNDANALEIDGVNPEWNFIGPWLEVENDEALEELREALKDKYDIQVKGSQTDFDTVGVSVEWAQEYIEASR